MDGKMNNPLWCCEKIQEKIEIYKSLIRESDLDQREKSIIKIIIEDLEEILYW